MSETTEPNGNGQNGKQKAFRIIPNNDDDGTRLILQTRWKVVTDDKLTRSARLFFVMLLDLALNPMVYVCRGVIRISQTKIGEKLAGTKRKASRRTINLWTHELETAGYVWTTEHHMPNAWPLLTYHITALVPRGMNIDPITEDGLWGNGKRRLGPVTGKIFPVGENQKTDYTGEFHNKLPLPPATSFPSHGSTIASPTGKSLPVPAATGCRSQRKKTASRTGNGTPVATAKSCPSEAKPVAHKIEGETPKIGETGIRVEGTKAVPPLPLPKFEPLDTKLFPRERAKIGAQQIEYLTGRINALETARQPAPNQADVIVAYKVRRRHVKAWMAGESL